MPKKILFVAEAVALAHVARPLVLASGAAEAGHEVVFAVDERDRWLVRDAPFAVRPISSIAPERFLAAIARGAPLFDYATLSRYVDEDLRLIADVRPDVVVGDLRFSLSASARVARIPYVAIANAYWSPYSRATRYVLPPLRAARALPLPIANAAFRLIRPAAFAWHALPLNRVRRRFGLQALPFDVRHVYTDGDYVLYADAPELYPLTGAPPTHRFLGPILWSPPAPLPPWWETAPRDRPIVYLTLGSSGDPRQLPAIVEALAALPVSIFVATAGKPAPGAWPANVFTADYLPGDAAARRAALVVCNGGAPTTQQALAAGVPVLGIATNMDQVLNMQAISRIGAGIALRGERSGARAVAEAAQRLLADRAFAAAAREAATAFARHRPAERFRELLAELPG